MRLSISATRLAETSGLSFAEVNSASHISAEMIFAVNACFTVETEGSNLLLSSSLKTENAANSDV